MPQFDPARRVGAARRRIGPGDHAECGLVGITQAWVGEVRMIEDVEEVSREARSHALGDLSALRDTHVEILKGSPLNGFARPARVS